MWRDMAPGCQHDETLRIRRHIISCGLGSGRIARATKLCCHCERRLQARFSRSHLVPICESRGVTFELHDTLRQRVS
jgi:hypothetical protein